MMLSSVVMLTTSVLVVMMVLSANGATTSTMAKLFPTADRDYFGQTTDDQNDNWLFLRKQPVCLTQSCP